jgi:hypothetical protein
MNYRNKYGLPILGILCDGRAFYFLEFTRQDHRENPRFSLGKFPDGRKGINIQSSNPELVQFSSTTACIKESRWGPFPSSFLKKDYRLALGKIGIGGI